MISIFYFFALMWVLTGRRLNEIISAIWIHSDALEVQRAECPAGAEGASGPGRKEGAGGRKMEGWGVTVEGRRLWDRRKRG